MAKSWIDKNIVILTGAGISAESGLRTFRDNGGLWEDHRVEDVATPEAFRRDPALVHRFYNLRRSQLSEPAVQPNSAHRALAELEAKWRGDFLLVTQNVDNLHRRAGSVKMLSMHGELQSALCAHCNERREWLADLSTDTRCPACKATGGMRPDIVWFGEMPYHMDEIFNRLECADLFVSIGTSGNVYPAAGFVHAAAGAHKVEINLEDTPVSASFHEHRLGAAGIEVPRWVKDVIG